MSLQTSTVACPGRVAIIGGGRWARVLTGVLCEIVSPAVRVSVHSPQNSAGMAAWAEALGIGGRVRVVEDWPDADGADDDVPIDAVIVANAAPDHAGAVEHVLRPGRAVLVEKPMALTGGAVAGLVALARDRRAALAAAHVFRFARYVDRFAARVAAAGGARRLRVEWTDPLTEQRWGEQKRYDAAVPLAADLLPHVLSLVADIVPTGGDRCVGATAARGGLDVHLDLMFGDVPCAVWLARESDVRRRIVESEVGRGRGATIRLDFADEPGTVSEGALAVNGDPEWGSCPRPVATMLTAFLAWASGGRDDRRLSTDLALRACNVSDQTMACLEGGR